jgi:polar amino acid transport system permease protein
MWDWEYAIAVFPSIAKALWITIGATIVGFSLAMLLGLILAILRRSKIKLIYWITTFFIEFVRGTPLLVQLFFIFYVLPFYGLPLSPFVAGVLALGIHYSTYCSEIYRSGIENINKGQWEAATALNFSPMQKWVKVVLPQAIPPIIPMLGNYLIAMFKETPLLSTITLVEILQTAKILGSQSFRYLEPFTIVGLLFLLLSYPSSLLVRHFEEKLNNRFRNRKEPKNKKRKDVAA